MRYLKRERLAEEEIRSEGKDQKSRKRQKIMDEERNCGRTKSALRHTKYFTESPNEV